MRISKRLLVMLFAIILSFSFVMPTFAATDSKDFDSKKTEVNESEELSYNWNNDDGEWICTDDFGEPVSGWAVKDNNTYFLNKDGKIKTGWIKDKGNWYYLYSEKDDVKKDLIGTLATDTWIDNYYVDKSGIQKKIKK